MNNKKYGMNKLFFDIALRFAEESHCLSHKVAAIAVKNYRIIATGINGTIKDCINCDQYFKKIYKENNIEIKFTDWIKTDNWRRLHHSWSNINEIHAEMSMIGECAKNGISLQNTTIYITHQPCIYCSKMLSIVGVKEIIYFYIYDKAKSESKDVIESANIKIQHFLKEDIS